MHRVQYLSAVQIKPWWQWHCFQWYEYWLKKCIWWELKLFVLINIFIDYHVSYQIHFSDMNTLKKITTGKLQVMCDGTREHVAPPAPALVTCFLLRNHLGMNLAINSSQITQKCTSCFSIPSASSIFAKTILCILICKWNKRLHLENISDINCSPNELKTKQI